MKDKTEYFMVSPDDTLIIGTHDQIDARGDIDSFLKLDDGTMEIQWAGETEVFWDSQVTLERRKEVLYLDRAGNEYVQSECRFLTREQLEEQEIEE